MNGYTYNNSLRRIIQEENLTPYELALMQALMLYDDMMSWNKTFTPRNKWLMQHSGIYNKNTFDKYRNSLIKKGLITFEPRKKNAGIYTFTSKIDVKNFSSENKNRPQEMGSKKNRPQEMGSIVDNRPQEMGHLSQRYTRVDRYINNKENPTIVNLMESKLVQQNLDYVLGELREWFSLYPNEAQRQQLKQLIVPYSQIQLGKFISKMVLNHVESGKEFAYLTTILRNNAYNMKKERRVRK